MKFEFRCTRGDGSKIRKRTHLFFGAPVQLYKMPFGILNELCGG